ncbi:hypothetical protein WG947_07375 [Pontibacter sp. H259]|uniref:hypothetical protein n=1 Tax=Pontibacter sp. H259 TaxID=3133421 RepID=UPI0030C4501E
MVIDIQGKGLGTCSCGSGEATVQSGELSATLLCTECSKYVGCYSKVDLGLPCCSVPNLRHTEREIRGGSKQITLQCLNCGHAIGNQAVAKNKVPIGEVIVPFNYKLNDDYITRLYQEFKEPTDKAQELRYALNVEQKRKEFDEWLDKHYYPYLKTDKWKRKEKYVLMRDNFLCQACLEKEATIAHHTSRQFFQNEPLFDLVAICLPCKGKIIDIEREYYSDPQKRKWMR